MNSQEKAIARMRFRLKIHESNGQAFEDLFTNIMRYAEKDFVSIKPWGNIGDRKNDGYIKSKGIFFQVFAPEEITKSYPEVIKKLIKDFNGLSKHWSPVKEFYFVVNDKYKGVHADCETAIQQIKNEHFLLDAGFKTAADLEDLLFSLNEDQIFTIIGFLPDPENFLLNYSELEEIIKYLMESSLPKPNKEILQFPDWDEKIKFNNLGDCESLYLNNGSLQIGILDEYLKNQSVFFADEVKKRMQRIYAQQHQNASGSELFWNIVNSITPRSESSIQSACIVLISKYFETCDIFERPE